MTREEARVVIEALALMRRTCPRASRCSCLEPESCPWACSDCRVASDIKRRMEQACGPGL